MAQFPFVVQSPRSPVNAAAVADRGMARAAAVQLADSINRYWAEQGYDAEARVVEVLEPQPESVVTRRQAIRAASGLAAGIGRPA